MLKPRENVSNEDLDWVIKYANSTGAIKKVSNYCLNQADLASKALHKLPNNSAKLLLEQLVDYLTVDRKA